ncbi:MAG TPA: terpene synthase family protein [Puia sp.]|nr:terpene synthase family protein [Puia sp.]
MKKVQSISERAFSTMTKIRLDYEQMIAGPAISLEALFSPDGFRFDKFCREFKVHPESEVLKERIREFGEATGCWLPGAKHHISCALYLYPGADTYRMFCMMKNLTLGFYLNDVMGRDTFHHLPADRQASARAMILRMSRLDVALHVDADADPLELVNAEILREFKDHSPQWWFGQFLEVYRYHIGITHTDGNVAAQGRIPGITEYMDYRCHLGGVHHILMWIEFSEGAFLDWEKLRRYGLAQPLKRLHWVVAAFAGLSNDLFSFEKEVIDNGSDSNLVMIIALNDDGYALEDAIGRAAGIVRALLLELLSLLDFFTAESGKLMTADRPSAMQLRAHCEGIVRCVQAIWLWHCYSGRYKRAESLWVETTLATVASASASGFGGTAVSAAGSPASSAAAFSGRG